MSQKLNLTSPVGRIVDGSLYNPQTTDAEGKPMVVKTGINAGQPRVNYYFALAIEKHPGETHWSQTDWGKQIYALGVADFSTVAQSPSFAWKIEDGDSQTPNKKGRKNVDREGYPGHWILKLSGGFAPKIYQQENGGYVQVVQKDFCKAGYFVEVAFSVEGNRSSSQPGVYLNHGIICFRGYGQEISFGADVASAGFGQSPLPMGASAIPLSGTTPMSTPMTVTPSPAFHQVPPAPIPAPPPVHTMSDAAGGVPYEAYIAQGWTDAMLIENGLMLA